MSYPNQGENCMELKKFRSSQGVGSAPSRIRNGRYVPVNLGQKKKVAVNHGYFTDFFFISCFLAVSLPRV